MRNIQTATQARIRRAIKRTAAAVRADSPDRVLAPKVLEKHGADMWAVLTFRLLPVSVQVATVHEVCAGGATC